MLKTMPDLTVLKHHNSQGMTYLGSCSSSIRTVGSVGSVTCMDTVLIKCSLLRGSSKTQALAGGSSTSINYPKAPRAMWGFLGESLGFGE